MKQRHFQMELVNSPCCYNSVELFQSPAETGQNNTFNQEKTRKTNRESAKWEGGERIGQWSEEIGEGLLSVQSAFQVKRKLIEV